MVQCHVTIKSNDLRDLVLKTAGIKDDSRSVFDLFVVRPHKVSGKPKDDDEKGWRKYRKVEDDEYPFLLFSKWQAHNSASSGTNIKIDRWLFTTVQEEGTSGPVARRLLRDSAVSRVACGDLTVTSRQKELLEEHSSDDRMYMMLMRRVPGYSAVMFRNCFVNFPDAGTNASVEVSLKGIRLAVVEGTSITFSWTQIKRWAVHTEGQFNFEVAPGTGSDRTQLTIETPESMFINACVRRVITELMWTKQAQQRLKERQLAEAEQEESHESSSIVMGARSLWLGISKGGSPKAEAEIQLSKTNHSIIFAAFDDDEDDL